MKIPMKKQKKIIHSKIMDGKKLTEITTKDLRSNEEKHDKKNEKFNRQGFRKFQ